MPFPICGMPSITHSQRTSVLTAPATMLTTAPPEHSHTPTRVVVGAAAGSAVGFILIILLVVHWYRHTALTRRRQAEEAQIGKKENGSPHTSFKDGKLVSSPATGGSGRSSTTNTPMIADLVQNLETVELRSQQPSQTGSSHPFTAKREPETF